MRADRRAKRVLYQRYSAPPSHWTGSPPEIDDADPPVDAQIVEGIGVSPGVKVGTARVLTSPDFDDVEPGEILVATFTDPGWAWVMFISAALVVDIGGPLSHAAVVARELGLPCVVNTQNGTKLIRTGDELRVNGDTDAVEILGRTGSNSNGTTSSTVSTRCTPSSSATRRRSGISLRCSVNRARRASRCSSSSALGSMPFIRVSEPANASIGSSRNRRSVSESGWFFTVSTSTV